MSDYEAFLREERAAGSWFNRCHFGDCLETLQRMPEGIVQTCVTSPPYFGLRDYGHPGQIGLEETPDAYVAKLVEVFREVRRVLRDDGTLWLNLGDSYANNGRSGLNEGWADRAKEYAGGGHRAEASRHRSDRRVPAGLKPKDLIGIPWMVAFALRADGWYLRQDIVWSKPNPMPESVTDRCTKSHEYVFLLSKSERYNFDAEAIKEPATGTATGRAATFDRSGNPVSEHVIPGQSAAQHRPRPQQVRAHELAKQAGLTQEHFDAIRAVGITDAGKAQQTQDGFGKNDRSMQALADEAKAVLGGYYREFLMAERRNKRSVWTVSTRPYSGAHFAVFPPELIEPCILAGAPAGGVVLDPFFGSGTTGEVAQRLARTWIGCELNPDYQPLQAERLRQPSLELAA